MSSILLLAAGIAFAQPAGVYLEGETVVWTGGDGSEKIVDIDGKEVGKAADGIYPVGVYWVGESGTSFTVIKPGNQAATKPYYGVMTALDKTPKTSLFECPWFGGDSEEVVACVAAKAGFRAIHGGLHGGFARKPGLYEGAQNLANVKTFSKYGLPISASVSHFGAWTDPGACLPRNLMAAYEALRLHAATYMVDEVCAWQSQGEPEVHGTEPAWEAATYQKVAYLALKRTRPEADVYNGALCLRERNLFDEAYFLNDTLKYMDYFDFHLYSDISTYNSVVPGLRKMLAKYGAKDMKIIFTENGTFEEGFTTRESKVKGMHMHTPEQEKTVACVYPRAQIELQMQGVAQTFYFFFYAYNEFGGQKDWGHFRRCGTVKPIYASFAAFLRTVGRGEIEGEVDLGKGLKGFLFKMPDGSRTLAYWAVKGAAGRLTHREFANARSRIDWIGRDKDDLLAEENRVSYIENAPALPIVRTPVPHGRPGRLPLSEDELEDVIVGGSPDWDDFRLGGHKAIAEMKGTSGKMGITVYNFSPEWKVGTIEVGSGSMTGLPKKFALPPMSSKDYMGVYRPATNAHYETRFTVRAKIDTDKKGIFKWSTRFCVPMRLEYKIAEAYDATPLSMTGWTKNDSSKQGRAYMDEATGAFVCDVAWPAQDQGKWLYPGRALKLPEESVDGADMIEFEVRSDEDKVENDYDGSLLMVEHAGGNTAWLPYRSPTREWEVRRVPLKAAGVDHSKDATKIRIGVNPRGCALKFEFRNVKVLRKKVK